VYIENYFHTKTPFMTITIEQIKEAYEVSKDVFNRQITRQDGVEKLKDKGMNVGSANIYLQVYQHLINGQTFTRTLSTQSFDYFLEKILADNGREQLYIALSALKNHINYFEEIQNTQMHMVGEIYKKYSEIYSENSVPTILIEDDDENVFPEGKEIYRLHKSKERNRELVKLAKELHLKNDAMLSCQICNFSFATHYGDLGKGFIEAHHIFPISQLTEETKTKIEDLALVCSNCHRMLHRKRPWLTTENLKAIRQPINK